MTSIPHHTASSSRCPGAAPGWTLAELPRNLKADAVSGFLVFLIALPLCLAIALASGYPAIAGVFTAIVGGVVGAIVSNSELTIKGPAAGLIVIAVGCVTEFGYTGGRDPAADFAAYRMALAVGVAAAGVQLLFALLRSGVLGELFPTAAVHGMLAAIGLIIMLKQVPVVLGTQAAGEPLELLRELPHTLADVNPEIALIGLVSLLILFGKAWVSHPVVQKIPAPLVVLLAAVPLGLYFDLSHDHTYSFHGHTYRVGDEHLVNVPFRLWSAVVLPDFRGLAYPFAWKWVVMYALIGSLESLLSAKAIDLLDPWKRRTNLDRDMLAVGIGNLLAAMIGGLPMISEIVRSRANIDNGALTRLANLFHGMFLLLCVALVPGLIHRIPLAALAAMLVYTGFRLAHPREFVHVFRIGPEQFAVYLVTIIAVLATDLLVGIAVGIGLKIAIHAARGAPLRSLLKPPIQITDTDPEVRHIRIAGAAVFSNWLSLRRQLLAALAAGKHVGLDLGDTRLVDHTVMTKLHEIRDLFERQGLRLMVSGLEDHQPVSPHPFSARRKPTAEPA